jgi:MFS family permease
MKRFSTNLIALTHRNFRLLWLGTFISMAGSMMRQAAILWHVSLLVPEGQKAIALGVVGLVRVVPIVSMSFVAGVVADALDRRKLMLLTNTALMIVSAALAAIAWLRLDNVGLVYALAAVSAAAGSFDNPARQSLYPTLIPREHLPNAISLNSIMFQSASVIGPALGGVLIGTGGVAWAYAFDAASFVVLLITLLLMRDVPKRVASERSQISLRAGLDGLRFVFSQPLIRSSMLLDFFATFFASATALLPIFAQDILKVGAEGYGLLSAAPALGAAVTSVAMVPLVERITERGRVLVGAVLVYGAATVVFGFSTAFWLTFACLAVTGAADMVSTVFRNIIRQLGTPDGLRGRMTSVNMMFFMGGPQLGELEAGVVAQAFGPVVSVVSGGLGCILTTLWIAWSTPGLVAYRREEPALAATD